MATSEKLAVGKKKLKFIEKNKDNILKKDKKGMKLSRLKKKRLIIRNLSFKVEEEELKKIFSKFGEILDVKIPQKSDGKKLGFAFIQFSDTKSMIKAMKKLNFQKIHGRPIAIDFAVNKDTYLSRRNVSNSDSKKSSLKQKVKIEEVKDSDDESSIDSEQEVKVEEVKDSDDESIIDSKQNNFRQKSEGKFEASDTESCNSESNPQEVSDMQGESEDYKVKMFLKEFNADDEQDDDEDTESETSVESAEDDEHESSYSNEHNHSNISTTESKSYKKKQSEDVSEGKTVFIRNISFKNVEEDLKEVVEDFGETVYCLFCNDPITGQFRGTAFVKFKEKESAETLIEESSKEPGILLDGRKLYCTKAVSREELPSKTDTFEKNRDKRNLRLLKCGLVAYGSKEAEGVSQTDMAKRAQLEAVKKQKLRNVNFFVSDNRLICHNIPKNVNDRDLHQLFKKAGGNGAVIKEARIMKDLKKTDSQGNPVSRGFAFIAFTEHEHALNALNELNNNPNVFTASKRPIVEFSIENKVALLSQKRRLEKTKQHNKFKKQNVQEKKQSDNNYSFDKSRSFQKQNKQKLSEEVVSPKKKFKKQNVQKKKQSDNNYSFDKSRSFQKQNKQKLSEEVVSPKKKKKQKKSKQKQHNQSRNEISSLTQMYKERLLNKLS